MNVLHVIPGIAARYGGPSAAIWPMVAQLNRLEFVCAKIATTDADGAGARIRKSDLPQDAPVYLFRRTCSERWKVSLGLSYWLRRHVRDYDIVHVHALWSFATAAAARAAERAGVPYIVRPAGMLSNYSWNRSAWQKRLYWRLVERRTIDRAVAFHVTSQQEAGEVRALRPDARVFIIPNGVDEAGLTEPVNTTALRQRCGAAAASLPIVLFLSRLHPKKGIVDLLLPAVLTMKTECCLAVAGGEDSHSLKYQRYVGQAIKQMGLQRRVVLLGSVPPNDRWAMFDGADAFVLPSHDENFGIVVAESMSRGCPVVVTDAVQSCEHVRAADAGEIVPRDVTALAAALDRVVSTPQRRSAYGDAGRQYAFEHFRWEKIANQVRFMYEGCLRQTTAPDNEQTLEHSDGRVVAS
jgi:glycosyltransferase involved in cell wall biosynthesis